MNQELWTAVDDYLAETLLPTDPVLTAATARGVRAGLPEIAVSANQGKFLSVLARMVNAKSILEIGTLAGYSTIWLGRTLPENGRLVTCEADPRHAEVARKNIEAAGLSNIVDIRIGKALDTLPQLSGPFDLFFIDADKEHNADYFQWALRLSRPGSVIIIDNVIRRGKIIDATTENPGVLGTRRLHELVAAEPRVTAAVLQTVGSKGHDGFTIAVVNE